MRTVIACGRTVMKAPEDYDARAQIMWAGSLSHNGLTGCGTVGDWSCHRLEHELSAMYDVAHGAGLAAIWGKPGPLCLPGGAGAVCPVRGEGDGLPRRFPGPGADRSGGDRGDGAFLPGRSGCPPLSGNWATA